MELLLQRGADVDALPRDSGTTSFAYAAMRGYGGIASVLLEAGADLFAKGISHVAQSALEGAAKAGRTDLVQLLLNVGEVLELPANQYHQALSLAESNDEHVIADLIDTTRRRAKADPCLLCGRYPCGKDKGRYIQCSEAPRI